MFENLALTMDAERAVACSPWHYPMLVNGESVRLGDGSQSSHDYLTQLQHYRDGVLGANLLSQLDFRGKSLRDYACNCGYWGLRAAARGLDSYVGIESQQVFVDQARYLWSQNLTQPCNYQFMQSNVTSVDAQHAPVDISFCFGILYHLPDWQEFLRRVVATTREAVVIETRISPSYLQQYMAELKLDADGDNWTDMFRTPALSEIYMLLAEAGWVDVRMLLNGNKPGHLLPPEEWFNQRGPGRVALIVRR
jgi:predicted RNA methylase